VQTAVVIEPASRVELEPVIALGYALTPREAQTLTLLLRGLPSKAIAASLHVTTHTANDHIKAIFTKTGVRSRGELMATVFREHYAPSPAREGQPHDLRTAGSPPTGRGS
jgi:DNA-binding CsgD family transcriptional regulator